MMKFEVSIPFQASLHFENDQLEVVGPKSLLLKVNELKKHFGTNPKDWPRTAAVEGQDDILINELIDQVNGRPFVYNHDELCHCRMIPTEAVKNAIKAGCRSVLNVSRTTMAGTGCGSCRPDIENAIKALTS